MIPYLFGFYCFMMICLVTDILWNSSPNALHISQNLLIPLGMDHRLNVLLVVEA